MREKGVQLEKQTRQMQTEQMGLTEMNVTKEKPPVLHGDKRGDAVKKRLQTQESPVRENAYSLESIETVN